MPDPSTDTITAWFNDHDDGDFARSERSHPFKIIGPAASARTILYTTKPQCVLALDRCDTAFSETGLIGRCGLPNGDDIAWLCALVGDRAVWFLGDADPANLLVFAWLRSRINARYAGISDGHLAKTGLAWDERVTGLLSGSESAALPLLAEVCADYRLLLGPQCAALWDHGRKIELEAVTIYPGIDAAKLVKASVDIA